MKGTIKISILSCIIILLQCCAEPKPIYHTITDDEIRYAATFKKGTYWVYKDSVTAVVDTIRVSSSYGGFSGNHQAGEMFTVYYETVGCALSPNGAIHASGHPNKIDGAIFSLFSGRLITKPFVVGVISTWNGSLNEAVGFTSFMPLRDSVFTNVYHHRAIYSKKDGSNSPINTVDYFFSSNQGFVKVVSKTDSSYTVKELVSYNLIK